MTRIALDYGSSLRVVRDGDVVRLCWQDAQAGTSRVDQCGIEEMMAWCRMVMRTLQEVEHA